MRCGTPTITWSQWISMPIAQRREASKGCGCRHSIGGARACSTSHEWRGSPPIGPSASTPKTFGKYHLNFPAIFSTESRNKGRSIRCNHENGGSRYSVGYDCRHDVGVFLLISCAACEA